MRTATVIEGSTPEDCVARAAAELYAELACQLGQHRSIGALPRSGVSWEIVFDGADGVAEPPAGFVPGQPAPLQF
ncbi:MAG: hypothetical protein JST54_29925 [Deltaproteobacteria bacterium]|nr:hypothetical protein [Deltaproteobacteria bacterium]